MTRRSTPQKILGADMYTTSRPAGHRATFTVEEFAERHLPTAVRDPYRKFMRSRQFPDRAVRRDTGDLRGKLKRRRFKYGTDIEFSASPDAIAEGHVTFDVVPVEDANVEGGRSEVTVITVMDT